MESAELFVVMPVKTGIRENLQEAWIPGRATNASLPGNTMLRVSETWG